MTDKHYMTQREAEEHKRLVEALKVLQKLDSNNPLKKWIDEA